MFVIKKIISNTSYIFAGKFIDTLVNFIIGIYLIRYLGPKNYGILSYVVSFIYLFQVLVNTGIDNILIREIAKEHKGIDALYSTGFYLKTAGAAMAFLCANIISFFITGDQEIRRYIFIVSITLFLVNSEYFLTGFQAKLMMKPASILSIGLSVFSACLKLGLILLRSPLIYFFSVMLLSALIQFAAFSQLSLKYKMPRLKIIFQWQDAKYVVRESWPLLLTSIFIIIYHRIDQIMLYKMTSAKEVGLYAAAVRLTEIWVIIPTVLLGSLLPIFSQEIKSSKSFVSMYNTTFRIMTYLAMPLLLYVSFYSSEIVRTIFGPEYNRTASVLAVLIYTVLFIYWGILNNRLLIATGAQRLDVLFTGLSAIVSIGLNLYLIPKYGVLGAAITTIASVACGSFVGLFIKETRYYSLAMWTSVFWPAVFLAPGIFLIHLLIKQWIVASIIFGSWVFLFYCVFWYFKDREVWKLLVYIARERYNYKKSTYKLS